MRNVRVFAALALALAACTQAATLHADAGEVELEEVEVTKMLLKKGSSMYKRSKEIIRKFWEKNHGKRVSPGGKFSGDLNAMSLAELHELHQHVQGVIQERHGAEASVVFGADGTFSASDTPATKAKPSNLVRREDGGRRRRCEVPGNDMPCSNFYEEGDMSPSATVKEAQDKFDEKCAADGHNKAECEDLGKDIFDPLGSQCFKDKADGTVCKLFDELGGADDTLAEEKEHNGGADEHKDDDDLMQKRAKGTGYSGGIEKLEKTLSAKCPVEGACSGWNSCQRRRDCGAIR